MKKFIVRRVLLGAMILFFVSMIIYSIERALPTSYVEGRARDMSMKQGAKPYDELVAELNAGSVRFTGPGSRACLKKAFCKMCVTICGRLRECFFRHALAQGILPVRQWVHWLWWTHCANKSFFFYTFSSSRCSRCLCTNSRMWKHLL